MSGAVAEDWSFMSHIEVRWLKIFITSTAEYMTLSPGIYTYLYTWSIFASRHRHMDKHVKNPVLKYPRVTTFTEWMIWVNMMICYHSFLDFEPSSHHTRQVSLSIVFVNQHISCSVTTSLGMIILKYFSN